MKLSRLALAVILAPSMATANQPSSQEDALKLSDSLVTANRNVQTRADSSAASSVFNRADIDRLQPSSVADLLNRVPGVQAIARADEAASAACSFAAPALRRAWY